MFAGRKKELAYLEKKFNSSQSEFLVVYGRRRIGKTELLKKFVSEKKHIFYSAIETVDKNQLELFSKAILKGTELEKFISAFKSWEEAFEYLAEQSKEQRVLLVIDEFPYMVNGNPSIPSILQNSWDLKFKNTQLMLILCGSSMAFMEKELLSAKNPLYGRLTGNYKVNELSVYETAELLFEIPFERVIEYYGIFGGVPHYLIQINQQKSLDENLNEIALERGSILFNEVEFLLRQELREVMSYFTVIQAIALGSTTMNEIEQKSSIDRTKLTYYLNNLIELGIVEKEFPVTMPVKQKAKSRKGLYFLKDSYFRFYFTYMFPYMSELIDSGGQHITETIIKPDLNRFMGSVFEKVSRQFLNRLKSEGQAPFYFMMLGRWWEKSEEVDIVALDQDCHLLVGECKWTLNPVGQKVLDKMISLQSRIMPDAQATWYVVFSKSGFTKELIDYSKSRTNVHLITLDQMR
ncbi:MAG: ATP-binding protein [Bacillota bacterium]|nr:ATP-binding protein [Bacillota bacterium]MDW7676594.1 ATP-binding protein [Bacillota bacterium]